MGLKWFRFLIAAFAGFLAAFPPPAGAVDPGTLIYTLEGDDTFDNLGSSLAAIDDVDGDGVMDFAAGAVQDKERPDATGYVHLYSGKTGKVLQTWRGSHKGENFGYTIGSFPDLDGDGKNDVLISDALSNIYIFSSKTGSLKKEIHLENTLAQQILISNDVDGDNLKDLFVGDPYYGQIDVNNYDFGRVFLASSKDGSIIWEVHGINSKGQFGVAVLKVKDLDGDGVDDFVAGESHGWIHDFHHPEDVPGSVYFLSGATGAVIHRIDDSHSFFGFRLANLGDLDSDAFDDVAVSAPGYSEGGSLDKGWVGVYSTRTFQLLWSFKSADGMHGFDFGGDHYGFTMSAVGDVDGDGFQDLLIGKERSGATTNNSWGWADLRSGKTGKLLMVFEDSQGIHRFASSMAMLGDADGDGRSEFLIGSDELPASKLSEGQVRLVRYDPSLPAFIRGDINGDGRVDLTDVISLIGIDVFSDPPGPCLQTLDVDGDDILSFGDVYGLLVYFFRDGFAPVPPFPECARYGGFVNHRVPCDGSACSP